MSVSETEERGREGATNLRCQASDLPLGLLQALLILVSVLEDPSVSTMRGRDSVVLGRRAQGLSWRTHSSRNEAMLAWYLDSLSAQRPLAR